MKKVGVIGAGIVGGSVAFHLTEQGAEVTVFDKSGPGSGATHLENDLVHILISIIVPSICGDVLERILGWVQD